MNRVALVHARRDAGDIAKEAMRVNQSSVAVAAGLGLWAALAAPAAGANTLSYSGTPCATLSCAGNSFGSNLTLPQNITFTDNPLSTGTTVEDWYFGVGTAHLGSTVTGTQIDLSSFAVTGTVDSFALYATTSYGGPITGPALGSGSSTSPFSKVILDPAVTGGFYALVVQSTLNPGAIGNYTGTLQIASVPLPAGMPLLLSGLAALGLLGLLGRRPSQARAPA